MGQQPQQALLLGVRPALQLKRHPEGASFAETEQGPHPPAQGPGGPGHHGDLQPQGQLPTGGMGAGGGPQGAQGGGAVVAGGGAAIGAGQVQHPAKLQGLQGRRHQRRGAAKGVEVHQAKAALLQQTTGQQLLGTEGGGLHATARLGQGGQVGLQQRQAIAVAVVDPHAGGPGLQPIAQAADAAAGHQVEHLQRLGQGAGQQHPQVAGGPRLGPEEAAAELQLGLAFAIVKVRRPVLSGTALRLRCRVGHPPAPAPVRSPA